MSYKESFAIGAWGSWSLYNQSGSGERIWLVPVSPFDSVQAEKVGHSNSANSLGNSLIDMPRGVFLGDSKFHQVYSQHLPSPMDESMCLSLCPHFFVGSGIG